VFIGLELSVWVLGFRVSGFGFRVWCFGFRVSGFGCYPGTAVVVGDENVVGLGLGHAHHDNTHANLRGSHTSSQPSERDQTALFRSLIRTGARLVVHIKAIEKEDLVGLGLGRAHPHLRARRTLDLSRRALDLPNRRGSIKRASMNHVVIDRGGARSWV